MQQVPHGHSHIYCSNIVGRAHLPSWNAAIRLWYTNSPSPSTRKALRTLLQVIDHIETLFFEICNLSHSLAAEDGPFSPGIQIEKRYVHLAET
jgi:hypothetical protein